MLPIRKPYVGFRKRVLLPAEKSWKTLQEERRNAACTRRAHQATTDVTSSTSGTTTSQARTAMTTASQRAACPASRANLRNAARPCWTNPGARGF